MDANNEQFAFPAGIGMLTFSKLAGDVPLWQGSLTLPDGTPAHIQAKAVAGKKPHYMCKVMNTSVNPWNKVTEFKLPAFGDKRVVDFEMPSIGKCKATKGMTSTKRHCIRITILNAPRSDHEIM